MPEYEKVACEYCGEMVSLHPMSQKKHKKECKMSPDIKEKEVEKPMVEPKDNGVSAKKPEEAELYRIAMQALERRKESPELFVSGVHSDERRELVLRYAPECVDPHYDPRSGKPRQFAEFHAFFCPKAKSAIAAHRGYVPVFDENKEIVQHEGDMLFKIPRSIWLHQELSQSNESKKRREAMTDAETEELRAQGGAGTTVESERTPVKLE